MPFKTILTVTGPGLEMGDLKLATTLCESVGAHLAALVIEMASPPPVGEYAAVVSDAWMQERQEEQKLLAARRDAVTEYLARSDVSSDVTADYPELALAADAIGLRARYADLTLLGPDLLGTKTLRAKAIDGALFSSGKPVLLVPDAARATLSPRRVMVGWDARLEASRAVREALDLLVGAQDVRLVLVDPVESATGHGPEPGADLATYLARHGVKASVERLPAAGHDVSAVLREYATDFDADMLVMGGYGHSRLRERIFGGVTRSMIDNPALPTFLAR